MLELARYLFQILLAFIVGAVVGQLVRVLDESKRTLARNRELLAMLKDERAERDELFVQISDVFDLKGHPNAAALTVIALRTFFEKREQARAAKEIMGLVDVVAGRPRVLS